MANYTNEIYWNSANGLEMELFSESPEQFINMQRPIVDKFPNFGSHSHASTKRDLMLEEFCDGVRPLRYMVPVYFHEEKKKGKAGDIYVTRFEIIATPVMEDGHVKWNEQYDVPECTFSVREDPIPNIDKGTEEDPVRLSPKYRRANRYEMRDHEGYDDFVAAPNGHGLDFFQGDKEGEFTQVPTSERTSRHVRLSTNGAMKRPDAPLRTPKTMDKRPDKIAEAFSWLKNDTLNHYMLSRYMDVARQRHPYNEHDDWCVVPPVASPRKKQDCGYSWEEYHRELETEWLADNPNANFNPFRDKKHEPIDVFRGWKTHAMRMPRSAEEALTQAFSTEGGYQGIDEDFQHEYIPYSERKTSQEVRSLKDIANLDWSDGERQEFPIPPQYGGKRRLDGKDFEGYELPPLDAKKPIHDVPDLNSRVIEDGLGEEDLYHLAPELDPRGKPQARIKTRAGYDYPTDKNGQPIEPERSDSVLSHGRPYEQRPGHAQRFHASVNEHLTERQLQKLFDEQHVDSDGKKSERYGHMFNSKGSGGRVKKWKPEISPAELPTLLAPDDKEERKLWRRTLREDRGAPDDVGPISERELIKMMAEPTVQAGDAEHTAPEPAADKGVKKA